VLSRCQLAGESWVVGGGFVGEKIEAMELYELGPMGPEFEVKMKQWFDYTLKALRRKDFDSLQRFALPHVGPFTRKLLDSLHIGTFDASSVREKLQISGGEVRARNVVAHVSANGIDRLVEYNESSRAHSKDRLPSLYLDHDRSGHAERQALLKLKGATGDVNLYISHRPCVSCIAAMVAFNTRKVNLKVVFEDAV